jgi:hypothetical protein
LMFMTGMSVMFKVGFMAELVPGGDRAAIVFTFALFTPLDDHKSHFERHRHIWHE